MTTNGFIYRYIEPLHLQEEAAEQLCPYGYQIQAEPPFFYVFI
jgi:hypothetical protein